MYLSTQRLHRIAIHQELQKLFRALRRKHLFKRRQLFPNWDHVRYQRRLMNYGRCKSWWYVTAQDRTSGVSVRIIMKQQCAGTASRWSIDCTCAGILYLSYNWAFLLDLYKREFSICVERRPLPVRHPDEPPRYQYHVRFLEPLPYV